VSRHSSGKVGATHGSTVRTLCRMVGVGRKTSAAAYMQVYGGLANVVVQQKRQNAWERFSRRWECSSCRTEGSSAASRASSSRVCQNRGTQEGHSQCVLTRPMVKSV
jgi:hypothetical protein